MNSQAQALLSPVAALYGAAVSLRASLYESGRLRARSLARPVVSVGNLSLGGTGKTPFVAALAQHFLALGVRPAILSRGYGRSSRGVVVVWDGERLRADLAAAGDEPLLLARALPGVPVVVGEERLAAGRLAEADLGAELHILDDGFQHLRLARALDLVLVDASVELATLKPLPAGRLREPLGALGRADAVIVTRAHHGHDAASLARLVALHTGGAPALASAQRQRGWRSRDGRLQPLEALSGCRAAVVAGIGNPGQFVADVEALGVLAACRLIYRDHHRFSAADAHSIALEAARAGASVIATTAKDLVRLEAFDFGKLELLALEIEALLPADAVFLARLAELAAEARA